MLDTLTQLHAIISNVHIILIRVLNKFYNLSPGNGLL